MMFHAAHPVFPGTRSAAAHQVACADPALPGCCASPLGGQALEGAVGASFLKEQT